MQPSTWKKNISVICVTTASLQRIKSGPMFKSITGLRQLQININVTSVERSLTQNYSCTIIGCYITGSYRPKQLQSQHMDLHLQQTLQLHLNMQMQLLLPPPQAAVSAAEFDLLLIGHAEIQKKENPDLEAALEQIEREELQQHKPKEKK